MENVPVVKNETQEIALTNDDVRKYFCENATEKEMALFINVSKINNLNPFKREVYLVKYGTYPASIITGFETYLKRAERTGKLVGWKTWTEGDDTSNLKACIEIERKDWVKPFYHEVEYSEYVAKTKEGNVTKFWKEKPKTMLKKVAMAQGFRFAFPDELAGLPYTREELNNLDIQEISPKHIKSSKPTVAMPQEIKQEEPEKVIEEEKISLDEQKPAPTVEGSKKALQLIRDTMAKCQSLEDLKNLWQQEMKDYQARFLPSDYDRAVTSKEYFKKILTNREKAQNGK